MKFSKEEIRAIKKALKEGQENDGKTYLNIASDTLYKIMLCDIYEMLLTLGDKVGEQKKWILKDY